MSVHVTAPMLAAYQHFLSVGFIENGAGAATGNFCQESGELLIATMFREHPDFSGGVPDALKSGGIAEWLGERKTAYIAFSARAEARLGLAKGSLLNDLGTQCDFVVYELQTTPEYATLYQQLTSGTRSIANLTANFMMIYERPALATAGLDNRIAHAEAVVERARLIKSGGSAGLPATPVPVPQVPVPQAPLHVPPAPPTATGRPPISATVAGIDAAILDNFGALRDALLGQRAAIDTRLAWVEAQAADFAKLEGASFELPPLLQNPAVDPAVIIPQGSQKMFGKNWKTSLAGLLAGASGVATQFPALAPYAPTIGLIATMLLGLVAKDGDVTGGTVPQTGEAARRTGTPVT